jgi:hypothetical protein
MENKIDFAKTLRSIEEEHDERFLKIFGSIDRIDPRIRQMYANLPKGLDGCDNWSDFRWTFYYPMPGDLLPDYLTEAEFQKVKNKLLKFNCSLEYVFERYRVIWLDNHSAFTYTDISPLLNYTKEEWLALEMNAGTSFVMLAFQSKGSLAVVYYYIKRIAEKRGLAVQWRGDTMILDIVNS